MLYLARNKSGALGCYSIKPTKQEDHWYAGILGFVGYVFSDDYKNVKWSDKEPTPLVINK